MRLRDKILTAAALVACVVIPVAMVLGTAATDNVDTPTRTGNKINLTVKNDEVIYYGTLVATDANGEAVSATDAASQNVVGMALEYVDNADDGEKIDVLRGVFRFANGGSFDASNIGDLAYVEDDKTVTTAAAATADIIAGVIVDVDSDGVWVDTFDIGAQGAITPASMAVAGAASVGTTLGVTGVTTCETNLIVAGTLVVSNATTLGSTVGVTGAATLSSTLAVAGAADLNADSTVTNVTVDSGATVEILGKPGASGYLQLGDAQTGATTNFLFALGSSMTIGDDGDGTLIETNTAAAAEYGLRVKINGDTYFLLLEKE